MSFFHSLLYSGSGVVPGWNRSALITAQSNQSLLYVPVVTQTGMKVDYSDLRFVLNPNGTSVEKLYLPYVIESSNGSGAYVKVGFPHNKSVGNTFYMLYGNQNANSLSNGRVAYGVGGWFYNRLDQPVQYSVNKYYSYDYALDDDATYQHAPSPHKSPYTGQVAYTYKRSELTEHGAAEGAKIMFKKRTGVDSNGYPTFTTPVIAFDNKRTLFPAINANVTTVTNSSGVARFNYSGGATVYTVGAYLNNTGFTNPSYNGDFIISASGAGYYELRQMEVNGGAPLNYSIGDAGSSQAVIYQVGINNNFMWTSATTGIILIDVNLIGSNTAQYTSVDLRRVNIIRVSNIDTTPVFTAPVLVGDDVYSAMSESHFIAKNGWMFWMGHGISRQDLTYPVLIFWSKDNGATINLLTISSPIGAQLNESTCVQIANANRTYTNKLFYIIRNEAAGQNYRFHTMQITMDDGAGTISNTTPVQYDLWDATSQSCPELTEFDMGPGVAPRVTFMYGDTHIFGYYTENDGTLGTDQTTWRNIGYPGTANQAIMNGSALSCGRPQPKPIDMGNQQADIYWCRNMRSGSPELSSNYMQFFDVSMQSLKTADSTTLIPARPRPRFESGVLIFGDKIPGYRTTSSSTLTVQSSHPSPITFTVAPGLSWNPLGGDIGVINNATNRYMTFTTTSYNATTGVINANTISNVGSGTQSSWRVNLGGANDTGNLGSNQMLNSRYFGNPVEGSITRGNARGTGSTLYTIGIKKDETPSVSTVTFTNGGAGRVTMKGLTFTPTIGLIADTEYNGLPPLGSGATILDHVTRFADSINWYGVGKEVSRTSTSVTFQFPKGYGTAGNSKTPTIVVTGTVLASASVSASGSTAEATSSYNNIVGGTALGTMHIKNNADTFNAAYSPSGFGDFEYDINSSRAIGKYKGSTVLTKLPANGNGIPNYQGAFAIGLSTTLTQPDSLIEFSWGSVSPGDETPCTIGIPAAGNWTQRADGLGLN